MRDNAVSFSLLLRCPRDATLSRRARVQSFQNLQNVQKKIKRKKVKEIYSAFVAG